MRSEAPVAIWVARGNASVVLATGTRELAEGEMLWLPGACHAAVRGAARSVVLPIRIREVDRAVGPATPFVAAVPHSSRSALIAAFTRSLGVLHGGGVRAASILQWIGHPSATIAAPASPSSSDLRRIAQALLDDPARSPAQVASATGMSESTLARRFHAETGWTPSRWRTRHLLARAADRIRADGTVAAGIVVSGYGSAQSFARAFRREWGVAPKELVSGLPLASSLGVRRVELGPQRTSYHVIVWVVTGGASLRIDGARTSLGAGDVACLPAGREIELQGEPGAAVLPLGWLPGGTDIGPGVVAHVADSDDGALLRLAAWSYAEVAPVGCGEPRHALQTLLGVAEPHTVQPRVAELTYGLLDQLFREPEDDSSIAVLATQLGVAPAELRNAVKALTGTSLAVWRSRTRMSWARSLLRDGLEPAQVARRLGYADAAALSHAFRRAHGIPPVAFRRRQLHDASR